MRRILFDLTIAFLAFGVGSFIAFKFYWKAGEKPLRNEETKITTEIKTEGYTGRGFATVDSTKRSNETDYEPKSRKATCGDKKLLPIWNELKKDKEFKEREKEGFYQAGDCSELIEVERKDLDDDGQKEFIIWGRYDFSGATGNSVIWIYEKRNGQYKQLLQSYIYKNGDEEWFEVKREKTKGYRNLLLKGHSSGYETIERYYEFDGNRYNEIKCLFLTYYPNENDPSVLTCKEAWEK